MAKWWHKPCNCDRINLILLLFSLYQHLRVSRMSHNFQILNNHHNRCPIEKQFSLLLLIRRKVVGANPSICSICYIHVTVLLYSFFFLQINKINLTALLQKRMKGAPLWNEVWVEMPYTGWCSEISMKQHQRKQRDSSVLYKGPCELSKCLRSHYWQHFFALQVFTWWPYGFHRSADADFLSSEMARTEWKTQSLRRQAVRHRHN